MIRSNTKENKIPSLVILFVLFALLQSCDTTKETGNSSKAPVAPVSKTKTALLKSTDTNGVKMFTLYDLDSKELSREETTKLDALAREIKDIGTCQVIVVGHADNTGTYEVNESISAKRARLVGDYLKNNGVANITTKGESYNHPVAGNDTAAGRAKNRRVEIYVSTIGKYNPYK